MLKEAASKTRNLLKKSGYNSRQVSVRTQKAYGLLRITIKNPFVDYYSVKSIAKAVVSEFNDKSKYMDIYKEIQPDAYVKSEWGKYYQREVAKVIAELDADNPDSYIGYHIFEGERWAIFKKSPTLLMLSHNEMGNYSINSYDRTMAAKEISRILVMNRKEAQEKAEKAEKERIEWEKGQAERDRKEKEARKKEAHERTLLQQAIKNSECYRLKSPVPIKVIFPALNKNHTMQENDEMIKEDGRMLNCEVVRLVILRASDYQVVTRNFLFDTPELYRGVGGEVCHDDRFDHIADDDPNRHAKIMNQWVEEGRPEIFFTQVTKVVNKDNPEQVFFVDTQGYDYARYVGRQA